MKTSKVCTTAGFRWLSTNWALIRKAKVFCFRRNQGRIREVGLVQDEATTPELEGNATVLDEIGIAATPKVFCQTVSDHLPIMVRLRSSGPDDD